MENGVSFNAFMHGHGNQSCFYDAYMYAISSSEWVDQNSIIFTGATGYFPWYIQCRILPKDIKSSCMHPFTWCHQMETFSALLVLCVGNSPVTGEFPAQRPVMRSFDVFFDLRLNKRLSKQSRGWRFGTPSCSLWGHCNELIPPT